MTMTNAPDRSQNALRPVHPGRIGAGGVLIAMGVVMLLDRTELLGGRAWQAFPGAILIAFGVIGVMTNWRACDGRQGSPLSGLWLMFVGCWLIANSLHLFGLTYEHSWPLLVVAGGIIIVLKELFPGLREHRRRESH
jgi:hypothetical protein